MCATLHRPSVTNTIVLSKKRNQRCRKRHRNNCFQGWTMLVGDDLERLHPHGAISAGLVEFPYPVAHIAGALGRAIALEYKPTVSKAQLPAAVLFAQPAKRHGLVPTAGLV